MGKKEELAIDIIIKMAAFEVKMKEIELLAQEMRRIEAQIDILTDYFKKVVQIVEPVINSEENVELNKS